MSTGREHTILSAYLKAIETLKNIPPDISEGEQVLEMIEELSFLADRAKKRVELFEESSSSSGIIVPEVSVPVKTGTEIATYEQTLAALKEATSDEVPFWKQNSKVVEILTSVSGAAFVKQKALHLVYEVENERLSLMAGDAIVFSLYGEETYEEIKSSLDLFPNDWFGPLGFLEMKPISKNDAKSYEIGKDGIDEVNSIISQPGFVKIGKMFLSFYGLLPNNSPFSHQYRADEDTILLLYKGFVVSRYRRSGVSWPHLVGVTTSTGVKYHQAGNWDSLAPDERQVVRNHFAKTDFGLSKPSYFHPLDGLGEISFSKKKLKPGGSTWKPPIPPGPL